MVTPVGIRVNMYTAPPVCSQHSWWKDIPPPSVRVYPASRSGGVTGLSMSAAHLTFRHLPASPSRGVDSAVPMSAGVQYYAQYDTLPAHHPSPRLLASPLCGIVGGSTQQAIERASHPPPLPAHTFPPNVAPSWDSILHEGSSPHCVSANFMSL
jgi:hypothetical protein